MHLKLLSRIKDVYRKSALAMSVLNNKDKYVYAESFYPEKPRKDSKAIIKEQVRHIFKYGEINKQYFEYGIDVQGVHDDDFMDYRHYLIKREKHNFPGDIDYRCLLKDKSLFIIMGQHFGYPVWSSIGTLSECKIVEDIGAVHEISQIVERYQNLFIKPCDGGGGKGTYRIHYENGYFLNFEAKSLEDICSFLSEISRKGSYLVQKIFVQHPSISKLYDKSVNTLRVVTANPKESDDQDQVMLVACIMRIGANGLIVDNHGQGGLEIAVDQEGRLDEYAFYKPGFGTKITQHPDSKIVFKGYQLPYYEESIELCKSFHTHLKNTHFIGWDVAFSKDGIYLFEANDSSGTKLQTFLGPLRDKYKIWLP